MADTAAVATRRALLREIHRLPPHQVEEVLSYVHSLAGSAEDGTPRSEPMAQAVQAVLGWAARAQAATADRLTLEEPVDEVEINQAPETPFTLPRLWMTTRAA